MRDGVYVAQRRPRSESPCHAEHDLQDWTKFVPATFLTNGISEIRLFRI